MNTVNKSSASDGPKSRSGKMSEKLKAQIPPPATLFQEDFLVRTYRTAVKVQGLKESVPGYGKKCSESFARFDRAMSLWRTSQLCLDGELEEFSGTWPRSGMTVNGIAYQLQPLELTISEIECSSSEKMQTIRKTCSAPSSKFARRMLTIEEIAERDGGVPNPEYLEWVMGLPTGWTDTRCSETAKSFRLSNGLGKE